MNLTQIQLHDFNRHHQAVTAITRALSTLDMELRAVARNKELQPGDRNRRQREARSKAEQTIRQGRAALVAAIAEDRQAARYADIPTGETLQRRAYYQQQAQADLAGRRGDEALTLVQQVLASGDLERTREYVRMARPAAHQAGLAGTLKALELDCMDDVEKQHRAFKAAIESVEANLPWLDKHVADLLPRAGQLTPDQVQGWEEEPPALSAAQVSMWLDRVKSEASVAGARHRAELDRTDPPEWARQQRPEDPAVAADGSGDETGAEA